MYGSGCARAGISLPSVMAGGVKPLTQEKLTPTEGKLSAGRHSNTLPNMGRGDYVTQEQRVKGSNLTGSRIWIILSPAGLSTSLLSPQRM